MATSKEPRKTRTVIIDNDLADRADKAAVKRFGYKKGNKKKFVAEAIEIHCEKIERE